MSAQEYKKAGLSFEAPCVDTLDCACRAHDRDCANSLGCSAKADRQLAKSATFNAVVNPNQRELSLGIAAAMALASITRER